MSESSDDTQWEPILYIGAPRHAGPNLKAHQYAALTLNQPIEDKDWFIHICINGRSALQAIIRRVTGLTEILAVLNVYADGGANRVKDLNLNADEEKISVCWPTLIHNLVC